MRVERDRGVSRVENTYGRDRARLGLSLYVRGGWVHVVLVHPAREEGVSSCLTEWSF